MIQIRNVPPELHKQLKIKAIEAGMSLSEFLLREITAIGEVPTYDELVARIRARSRRRSKMLDGVSVVDIIKQERSKRP